MISNEMHTAGDVRGTNLGSHHDRICHMSFEA